MHLHLESRQPAAYRGRILVVEDDPGAGEGLKIRLSASGYDVVTARSAKEGYYKARHERPDAILMDLGLPDADGLDLLAELRKSAACQTCPVIVLTSRDPREAKLSCISTGAQSFLQKPFDSERLLQEIARLMGQGDRGPQSSRIGAPFDWRPASGTGVRRC